MNRLNERESRIIKARRLTEDGATLEELGAEVSGIRRARARIEPELDTVLAAGDVVVLRGSADAVTQAEGRLL